MKSFGAQSSSDLSIVESVVTFGSFGPPILAFTRRLSELGIQCYHIELTEKHKRISSNSVSRFYAFSPKLLHSQQGIEKLIHIITEVGARCLVTVSEDFHLWLSKNANKFPVNFLLLFSPYNVLANLASKVWQIELAQKVGFDILPTWYIFVKNDCDLIDSHFYPLCLRPAEPNKIHPTFKVKVVHTREEALGFISEHLITVSPIIAQPFKKCPDIQVFGVRSHKGVMLEMKQFLAERKFEGVCLSLTNYMSSQKLNKLCKEFVDRAKITGCFHFDILFCEDEEKMYFLEINARLGGTTDKALLLGYDEPRLLLRAFGFFGKNDNDLQLLREYKRVVNKRAIVKHIIKTIAGKLTETDYPQSSKIKHLSCSLRDLLWAKDSVFTLKDVKGSIWFHTQL